MTTGKGLNDLALADEPLPTQSLDDLPDFGGFAPPPQPGAYRFKLPGDLGHVWESFDSQKGQRIRAIFDRDSGLLIVKSPGNRYTNEVFQTRISNAERKRGKAGPEASDLDYLLRALGEKARPTTNRQYIETLQKHAGAEFSADITYSFRCSDQKDIRVPDPANGERLTVVEGQKGCGKSYYQRDVEKNAAGEYPTEITCECGAVLRTFANLEGIRA